MTAHGFHPEALVDLDEIWEFIRTDNLAAADRAIAGNPIRHSYPGSISSSRSQTPGPQFQTFALHPGTRISDCLCAG